jgi:hypothetical protein
MALADNVVVELNSPMRYWANRTDPGPGIGSNWIAESFDDSTWPVGPYGVGYEEALPGATALLKTTTATQTYSIYTRAHFTIDDKSIVGKLTLGADYDDGYVAWINGVEVARSSTMPAGFPDWNANALSHESSNGSVPNYGTLIDITATALDAIHDGDNVLVVGVWNNGPGSSDLVVVPRLAWECQSVVTRGPYLQMGTPTSVIVRWRSLTPTASTVRYGAAPGNLNLSTSLAALTTEHEIALTGLQPATRYYYSVGSPAATCAGNDSTYFFVTSPPLDSTTPTRIWVLGNSG